MPQFPRYESKATPTTQQPSVQAPSDTSGEILQQGAKVAGAVGDTAIKWSNALDTIQKTTAQANFKSGMLDIQQRAINDPNYNNSEQYFSEINKLKAESLKGFRSKTAETEMALDLGYEAKVGQIQIENLYKKKTVDVGQASILKNLDLMARDSGDIDKRIEKFLQPQIRDGIIGREDAYKLQKEYVKKAKYNGFLSDLSSSPSVTESKLSKNEYGFDVKELRDAKSIYESESKKIQAITENEVLTAYLTNDPNVPKPDEQAIKQLLKDNKIDAKFAESMITKINDVKPDKLSQDMTYIDFQTRSVDALAKGDKASIQEITQLMSDTIEAHAKGLLDKADVEKILKDRNALLQEKLEPQAEKIMDRVKPKNWLQKLSFWSDEYAGNKPEIKARMYRQLMDGVSKGEDGDMLLANIVENEIEIQMADNLKNGDRQFYINPDTKQRIYSDDGGATWFDEKTGKEVK